MHRLVIAVVALPLLAFANAKQDAKAHVAKATKAHQDGKFDVALDELQAAYKLDPQPELLFAIAQVYAKLDKCGDALPYYEKFAATLKDAQQSQIVGQAIDACKAKIATVEPTPDPVKPDEPKPDEPKPDEPKPDEPPTPAPVASEPVTAPPPPHEQPAGPTPWYRDTIGDTLVGGGVLAGVASLVMYESAVGDLDAAEASTTLAAYNQHLDDGHTKRTYSVVLFGAGVALATVGVVHYLRRDASKPAIAVVPASHGGVVVLSGGF